LVLLGPAGTEVPSTDDAAVEIVVQQLPTAGMINISVAAATTALFDPGGPFPPAVTRRA